MSLEVTILGISGHPEKWVELSVDEHTALLATITNHPAFLLNRMHDYYEDACFSASELQDVLNEAAALLRETQDNALNAKLTDIKRLLEEALRLHRDVHVLAD